MIDLNWKPKYSFQTGLRETVAWYVEHRDRFNAARLGYNRERLGLGTAKA